MRTSPLVQQIMPLPICEGPGLSAPFPVQEFPEAFPGGAVGRLSALFIAGAAGMHLGVPRARGGPSLRFQKGLPC